VTFILPGRDVLYQRGNELTGITGSSVATAFASGLAALILLCADIVDKANGEMDKYGKILRKSDNTAKVFQNLSEKSNRRIFPEVQKYFVKTGNDLQTSDLEKLLNQLTARVCNLSFFFFFPFWLSFSLPLFSGQIIGGKRNYILRYI
jgi:hypothetical protein